jgi:hypothetical protein
MMNSPGVPLTISLVLAREAGVKDPAVDLAIERSAHAAALLHRQRSHPLRRSSSVDRESRGQRQVRHGFAVLFSLLGESKGAEFFSRMSLASHGPERDTGHTGNFFNMLWAMPGVAQGGPQATGAWMQEFGAWYFDLARRWDGTFLHQGPPERGTTATGWDATGAYLLALAMPKQKLLLTGKRASVVPQLDRRGRPSGARRWRGWDNKDRHSAYDRLSDRATARTPRQLVAGGARTGGDGAGAPQSAAGRPGRDPAGVPERWRRATAPARRWPPCARAPRPAVPTLRRLLSAPELWLRIQAARALAHRGQGRQRGRAGTARPAGAPTPKATRAACSSAT